MSLLAIAVYQVAQMSTDTPLSRTGSRLQGSAATQLAVHPPRFGRYSEALGRCPPPPLFRLQAYLVCPRSLP
ncbi:hypothetical protein EB795_24980 [Pseudomonas mandelii]|nr:hypothetical protein [Pseudomonas mandelii]